MPARIFFSLLITLVVGLFSGRGHADVSQGPNDPGRPEAVLVVHGGAGDLSRMMLTPFERNAYRSALEEALLAGYARLQNGDAALDAVQAAIIVLEDSPYFNAGRGAVFNSAGDIELDAAIMDGRSKEAGAVAIVQGVRNPILLARAVKEKSGHVMLAGKGARRFAKRQGFDLVGERYFRTDRQWRAYKRAKKARNGGVTNSNLSRDSDEQRLTWRERKYGTVGAIARDRYGNLAAGGSTGGSFFKRPGRIGDTPIVGAGVYADNATCAVAGTGEGEFFIRLSLAYQICSETARIGLVQSAEKAVLKDLASLNAKGGVIALAPVGPPAAIFNTKAMFRGVINDQGSVSIHIFADEDTSDNGL
ncbi:MAG: isoaspartyl peptidase/L-asparaginase [Pseudomonadota bacterium]